MSEGLRIAGPPLVLYAALIAIFTAGLVRLIERWARARALLDVPNARSSHDVPTPRLGGLAIIVIVPPLLVLFASTLPPGLASRLVTASAASIVLALLGLIDDVRPLPAGVRLLLQVAVCTAALARLTAIDGGAAAAFGGLGALAFPIALIWLVGFVNAFNFMDGIDGIAGVQACIAGLAWAWIGWQFDEPVLFAAGGAVAAACGGFLYHNWSPARIFMGDAGSTYLGFLLAVMPLLAREPRRYFIAALFTVWVFVFDTTFTMARRALRGENLMMAHRTHLYQRLTQTGLSHARVSTGYAALAVLGAAAAVLSVDAPLAATFAGAGALVVAALLLWHTVTRRERQATAPSLREA